MTDILIRALPETILEEIDRQARELGISRGEFLRRRLCREFRPVGTISTADLIRLAGLTRELGEPEPTDTVRN